MSIFGDFLTCLPLDSRSTHKIHHTLVLLLFCVMIFTFHVTQINRSSAEYYISHFKYIRHILFLFFKLLFSIQMLVCVIHIFSYFKYRIVDFFIFKASSRFVGYELSLPECHKLLHIIIIIVMNCE